MMFLKISGEIWSLARRETNIEAQKWSANTWRFISSLQEIFGGYESHIYSFVVSLL